MWGFLDDLGVWNVPRITLTSRPSGSVSRQRVWMRYAPRFRGKYLSSGTHPVSVATYWPWGTRPLKTQHALPFLTHTYTHILPTHTHAERDQTDCHKRETDTHTHSFFKSRSTLFTSLTKCTIPLFPEHGSLDRLKVEFFFPFLVSSVSSQISEFFKLIM